ncbi:DUF6607 family protein [Sinimarinibacterium thermocellulolyticum]|uniref:DUF6607 family protein n=1 Tax=Sinimarinibacterium thermocellulolyticum TaxID=3170016 RepID=A0ABV2ADY2_9GAMM
MRRTFATKALIDSVLLLSAGLIAGCTHLGSAGAEAGGPAAATSGTRAAVRPIDDPHRTRAIAAEPTPLARDRAAILAMQGEYQVSYTFKETAALKSGYTPRRQKTDGAWEVVILVEDSPRHIVLQHLLVSSDGTQVIKHWRQDWHYEATSRWEFTEDQTWRLHPLPEERIAGHWTQCVYEVSDAPRYCGTGRWNHRYGVSTWTSDRSWRPLPRREYTQRSDYNALNAENRHTITPSGWTHEQDNTKTVRDGSRTRETLVREFGFNDYRLIEGFDFSPAYDYWARTKAYWANVRAEWTRRLAADGGIRLRTAVDGMPIITAFFEQAERVRAGGTVADAQIRAVFERWTAAPGTALAASAPAHARGE